MVGLCTHNAMETNNKTTKNVMGSEKRYRIIIFELLVSGHGTQVTNRMEFESAL